MHCVTLLGLGTMHLHHSLIGIRASNHMHDVISGESTYYGIVPPLRIFTTIAITWLPAHIHK